MQLQIKMAGINPLVVLCGSSCCLRNPQSAGAERGAWFTPLLKTGPTGPISKQHNSESVVKTTVNLFLV